MSVFEVRAPFLTPQPQVYGDENTLYCESSLFAHLVSIITATVSWNAADSLEWYTVSLALRNPTEEIPLATFDGEGSHITSGLGVLAGDSLFDLCGDQGDASKRFVVELKRLLGVPIGLPVPHGADESGVRCRCGACGRPSPPRREKFGYCDGLVTEDFPSSVTKEGR